MAFKVTAFKVNTVSATVAADGATATVTLPYSAAGTDVVISDVTASDSVGTCTGTVPASTKVADGNVTVSVTDGTNNASVTLTITVEAEPEPTPAVTTGIVVKNINMAGWFKVKLIELKEFSYEAGGFTAPYKAKAVLTVNAEDGMVGYVDYANQKVMLYTANGTEASGDVTADVYLLLE